MHYLKILKSITIETKFEIRFQEVIFIDILDLHGSIMRKKVNAEMNELQKFGSWQKSITNRDLATNCVANMKICTSSQRWSKPMKDIHSDL